MVLRDLNGTFRFRLNQQTYRLLIFQFERGNYCLNDPTFPFGFRMYKNTHNKQTIGSLESNLAEV